jgi:hypothetical protein
MNCFYAKRFCIYTVMIPTQVPSEQYGTEITILVQKNYLFIYADDPGLCVAVGYADGCTWYH